MPNSKKLNKIFFKFKQVFLIALISSFLLAGQKQFKTEIDLKVFQLPSANKVVALTFDDGPRHGSCEQLLDLLREEDVKATFFVVGKSIYTFPDLLFRIYREGHDIGNHSYSHCSLDFAGEETVREELERNNEIIKKITGQKPKYFRAPGGRYSRACADAARKLRLTIVNWSLNPGDYNMLSPIFERGERLFVKTPEMITEEVLVQVKPGDIILLHNGTYETVEALRAIIPALKARGYRFAKISDYY
jgi:peptidoglycan/xylan/chitin deacetylase (PgdA/CDA1 family)